MRVRLNDLYFPGAYWDGGLKKGDVILVSSPHACISITPPMEICGGCDRSQVLISPVREDVLPRSEDARQFWCNWAPPPSSHFPVSNGHPIALGAAPVTGGKLSPRSNYLEDHILFTSESNAKQKSSSGSFFAWKYLRIAAPTECRRLCWQPELPGSGKVVSLPTSPFSIYLAVGLIKAQRLNNGWFNGKIQLACTSGCVMRACFPTNDLGPFAFIGLLRLASCGISCWTRGVI